MPSVFYAYEAIRELTGHLQSFTCVLCVSCVCVDWQLRVATRSSRPAQPSMEHSRLPGFRVHIRMTSRVAIDSPVAMETASESASRRSTLPIRRPTQKAEKLRYPSTNL